MRPWRTEACKLLVVDAPEGVQESLVVVKAMAGTGAPFFFLFTQLAVVWGQPIAGFHTVPVMPLARDARVMRDGDMRCSRIRTQSGPNF